jgi:hypothetical protein
MEKVARIVCSPYLLISEHIFSAFVTDLSPHYNQRRNFEKEGRKMKGKNLQQLRPAFLGAK